MEILISEELDDPSVRQHCQKYKVTRDGTLWSDPGKLKQAITVTFVLIPSPDSILTALRHSLINGTLTTSFLWILARARPSLTISGAVNETASRLMVSSSSPYRLR
jgi:hypothetical protein